MIKEINKIFEEILEFAERNQTCLRKAVGCSVFSIVNAKVLTMGMVHNGPSRDGAECTNEVGNCGCSHAEPRMVKAAFAVKYKEFSLPLILVCTYSPCTTCANIIIDSGIFSGVIYDILTNHDTRGEKFLRDSMPIISREELNKLTESEASDKIKKWISN